MRAVTISGFGGPEVLREVVQPDPAPGPHQILVRVRASALNRADLLQRRGAYPAPEGTSPIPGLEYAGEVAASGAGVSRWAAGDRVMGIVGGGGHAELLCVHEREAVAVPDGMGWPEAAAIPEVFMTAYDAISRQLRVGLGDRLLIHAVGSGVGTAAVQLARLLGATTLGTSRSPAKLARARELGLDVGIDASGGAWPERVEAEAGREGVTALLDLVGGSYLAGNLRVLAPKGRMIVVGTTAGRTAELDLGTLLRKRLTLVGTVLRTRPLEEKIALARDFEAAVMPQFAAGRLKPVVDSVLPFTAIQDAHRRMEANDSFGKIVLRWE